MELLNPSGWITLIFLMMILGPLAWIITGASQRERGKN